MEPERKIEKLLRACAKKRRAEAGDAPRLHPATRRRLQGEVSRQFAEPPEEESVPLWRLFRQQWAVLTAFALAVFFVAAMFLPALSKAKMKSQSVSAMSNLKQIGTAAQMAAVDNNGKLPVSLDALTNELASNKALTDPVSGKRFVYVAGGEMLDELQTNSVLAYSPEDKKGRAVLLADGRVEKLNAAQFEELNRHGLVQRATPMEVAARRLEVTANNQPAENRPAAVAAPSIAAGNFGAAGSVTGFGGGADGMTSRTDRNARVADQPVTLALAEKNVAFKTDGAIPAQSGLGRNSQRFMQTVAGSAKTAPVLATFEVRQSGNAIAVVDRDGSVYNGSFQSEIPVAQNAMLAATPPSAARSKDASVAKNEMAAAQNGQNGYFFRVSGQNRTLKQNVVFTGNLTALPDATVNGQKSLPGNNSSAGGAQATFSNSRITGTVTVDDTNQVEINAVPVAP